MLAVLGILACFPDPPTESEDDEETTATEAVEDTERADTFVPEETLDTSTDTAADETAIPDAAAADMSTGEVEEDIAVPEVETEVVGQDTSSELDSMATSDSSEDTREEPDTVLSDSQDDVSDTVSAETEDVVEDTTVPECNDASQCQHLGSECIDARCQQGRCVARPLSEGPCDDGSACTEADTCDEGVCQGAPIVCEALSSCHDPGVCDPGTGRCSNPVKEDASPCDDGLKCTDDDECTDGVCRGTTRVCQAADQCHEPGECNPATGLCSNPQKPDFSACDDGDPCTVDDFCAVHQCQSGPPPDDSIDDWIMILEGDGDIEIQSFVERPNGSVLVLGRAEGTHVSFRDGSGRVETLSLDTTYCALWRLNLTADGKYQAFSVIGGASECEDDWISNGMGLIRLADGTMLSGGAYSGARFQLTGQMHTLGQSPSDLATDYGMWIGRMNDSGDWMWVTDLIGAGLQSQGVPYRSLAASSLGISTVGISVRAGGALELVYDVDDSEVILNSRNGTGTGYLMEFAASGRRITTTDLTCDGQCTVMPTLLALTNDGTLYVGGAGGGGPITAKGASPADDVVVETGLTTTFEGWLIAYGSTGPLWGRHFISAFNALEFGAFLAHITPLETGVVGLGHFVGQARTRRGEEAYTLLASSDATDPPDPSANSLAYSFGLDVDGDITSGAFFRPEGSLALSIAAEDSGRVVVVGSRDEVIPPATDPVQVMFVNQFGSWDRNFAIPNGSERVQATVDGSMPLLVEVTPNGVVVAANIAAPATVGVGTQLTLDPPEGRTHATIMRINSRGGLECE